MSRAIVAHCFNAENLTRSEKSTLLAMADFAGNHGICYACQEKIAIKIGYSIRTIRNAIQSLVKKGWLIFMKRGLTNVYKFPNIRERNAKAREEKGEADIPKTYESQYRKDPPDKKISPKENRQFSTLEPAKTAGKQVKTTSLSTHNRMPADSQAGGNRSEVPADAKRNPAPTPPAQEGLTPTPEPVANLEKSGVVPAAGGPIDTHAAIAGMKSLFKKALKGTPATEKTKADIEAFKKRGCVAEEKRSVTMAERLRIEMEKQSGINQKKV